MKHRLYVPRINAADPHMPDVPGWVHSHGWQVTLYEAHRSGIMRLGGQEQWLRITLVPWYGHPLAGTAEITVTSGATLIYDDVERSMAVTLEPEPRDAVPVELEDAVPIEPQDATPAETGLERTLRAAATAILGTVKPDLGDTGRTLAHDAATARALLGLAGRRRPAANPRPAP